LNAPLDREGHLCPTKPRKVHGFKFKTKGHHMSKTSREHVGEMAEKASRPVPGTELLGPQHGKGSIDFEPGGFFIRMRDSAQISSAS
jgi:hypothetical protein